MSHHVIPPQRPAQPEDQLSIDEISSPISAQVLELCDPDLFPETLQNCDVTSSSNNCCYEETSSSYATNVPLDIVNNNTDTAMTTTTNMLESSQEDMMENDISASIDFSSSSQAFSVPNSSLQYDFSLMQPHYPMGAPLVVPSVFEEDCLSSMPSYVPLNHPSSFMGPYMPPPPSINTTNAAFSAGIYGGSMLLGSKLQVQELEYQAENGGIYCPDSIQQVFNPPNLQALSSESQQVVGGAGSSNLEDSTFKVGKLSFEQRKEKIDRYMKKRNERNFNKKIKYACRKTLADSRPRVRGRFAKNDEFGENHRPASSNHEEEDEEEVVVKEEDDMVDSSDIFAYISGVNSFKCNQSIQSWI